MPFDLPEQPPTMEQPPIPSGLPSQEREPSDLELYEKAIQRTRELLADSGLEESDPSAKGLFEKIAKTMIAGKPGSQAIRVSEAA